MREAEVWTGVGNPHLINLIFYFVPIFTTKSSPVTGTIDIIYIHL